MKSTVMTTALGLVLGLTFWLSASAQSPQPPAPSKALPVVAAPERTEADGEVAPASAEVQVAEDVTAAPLEKLAWMVGEWVDEDETSKVETSVAWTKNRKFLRRMFQVTPREGEPHSGLQIIGWDAAEKSVRSWTYDADGGFGEEQWRESGDRWIIRSKYTLADGEKATATNIMKRLDDDRFTFRSVNRTIAGALQPDIDEVMVVRKSEEGDAPMPAETPAAPETAEPAKPAPPPAPAPASESPQQEKKS
jgi:hypothetical protein